MRGPIAGGVEDSIADRKEQKAALEAGKHGTLCPTFSIHPCLVESSILTRRTPSVVIEKPFTVTSAQADGLISLAKEKKKILTVYQNRRYDSDYRTLKHLVSLDPNPFGKVTEFASYYDIDDPAWVKGWVSPEGEPGTLISPSLRPRSCEY